MSVCVIMCVCVCPGASAMLVNANKCNVFADQIWLYYSKAVQSCRRFLDAAHEIFDVAPVMYRDVITYNHNVYIRL